MAYLVKEEPPEKQTNPGFYDVGIMVVAKLRHPDLAVFSSCHNLKQFLHTFDAVGLWLRMMRMKHRRVNPNNTSVADFDNYPGDKPPSSACEYDNEDRERQNTKVISSQ